MAFQSQRFASLDELWNKLEQKTDRMIDQMGGKSPHVAKADGVYDDNPTDAWTSGFWPGILWLMYEMTGKERYKEAAWDWDRKLEENFVRPSNFHHDVGFQFLPTAIVKYRLTGDADAKRIGLEAANFLAGRFNLAGRFIRAWNNVKGAWHEGNDGWAIIDCMMNLPLLMWASGELGDPRFKHIAVAHADTALANFVRDDGSTRHICCFDPETGEFLHALGGQGFAPDSAWSRGNAWALYGFSAMYRLSGQQRYLDAAKRVAHFFIASVEDDFVPLWDFRVDNRSGAPRDSSAAAIAASGLIDISKYVPAGQSGLYLQAAERMIASLTDRYATWDTPEHEAILLHGTGHLPRGANIDVSLIYGDYYYVEAVSKLKGWNCHMF
ncbi:glycoside hydrolase family 88 protein [Paenibacillus hamazuiensis]|uniref:glycoside hydrolase family 88 protein n=1 Tax=Paenibacillus hamazuiensis TaxID=2936508 RepID=UPI00200C89DE|nr:glycoside hydrolase family 88 protein [Paenibacillus hamazuiensis]